MRVLFVTVSMPFGHGEAFFIPEVKEYLRQGCELLIVPRSPSGEIGTEASELARVTIRRPLLSARILGAAIAEFVRSPTVVCRACALLLSSHTPWTLVKNLAVIPKGLWLARLARELAADHIHAQWGLTTSTMGLVASTVSGVPWSCTVHRGDIIENNLLELKARHARFLRVICEDALALAAQVCGRPLQGNVLLLHACVDLPTVVPDRVPLHTPPMLLCPAFLHERKGHRYLIEAVGILRRRGLEVRLRLTGDGPSRTALQSLVTELGLRDVVEFLGLIDHGALLDFYTTGAIDLVVLPTLHEGIPGSLMEAMAHGIPVVSTDTGGIPELLRDGAGTLVAPRDATGLADAVERLICDADLRWRHAEAGRRRIQEEFAPEGIVSQLLQHIAAASVRDRF